MSNIVKCKDDLKLVKDIFELLRKETVTGDLLEEVVKILIPKDKDGNLLVGYQINDRNGGTPAFSLSKNFLNLSIDEMYRWVDINSKKFINDFGVKDVLLFKNYMFLYIMCHEIEHSYQYLMAYGAVDAPCELVSSGYKLIIDTLLSRNYNKIGMLKIIKNAISYYLYNINNYKYVIERNANVEAFDLLQSLTIENGHEELSKVFNSMRNAILIWGYVNGNIGSFEETCNGMLIGREYRMLNHDYELSEMEKIRYGLPILKETREKIKIVGRIR